MMLSPMFTEIEATQKQNSYLKEQLLKALEKIEALEDALKHAPKEKGPEKKTLLYGTNSFFGIEALSETPRPSDNVVFSLCSETGELKTVGWR